MPVALISTHTLRKTPYSQPHLPQSRLSSFSGDLNAVASYCAATRFSIAAQHTIQAVFFAPESHPTSKMNPAV